MAVAILLSFAGTDKEQVTAYASIAFFVLVSLFPSEYLLTPVDVELVVLTSHFEVYVVLRREFERHPLVLRPGNPPLEGPSQGNVGRRLLQLDFRKCF